MASEQDTQSEEAGKRVSWVELYLDVVFVLAIGELAVWVGVSAAHRDEAFRACRYIIDELKHRVPIWKKEHYLNGDSGWVNCERCASAPRDSAADDPVAHGHVHDHA